MRKTVLVVLAVVTPLGAGSVQADDVAFINPKLVAGFGMGDSKRSNDGTASMHIGIGFTLFSPDRRGIVGFGGFGFNMDHTPDIWTPDPYQRAGEDKFLITVIPVRVGPLSYEFSWNKHEYAFGHDRGRVHFVKLDILGLVRSVQASQ